jgi:hypothetical protein
MPNVPPQINKFDGKKLLERMKRKEKERKEELIEGGNDDDKSHVKKAAVTPESFKKELDVNKKWNAINKYSLQEIGKRHKIRSIFGETIENILGKEDFF